MFHFMKLFFHPVFSSDPFSAFYQRPIWPFLFGKNLATARFRAKYFSGHIID